MCFVLRVVTPLVRFVPARRAGKRFTPQTRSRSVRIRSPFDCNAERTVALERFRSAFRFALKLLNAYTFLSLFLKHYNLYDYIQFFKKLQSDPSDMSYVYFGCNRIPNNNYFFTDTPIHPVNDYFRILIIYTVS